MNFSRFFSEQAKKPKGFFGRIVMSIIFDGGNAFLNGFVNELMSVKENDHVLEIGFGTGKLIQGMAKNINNGHIEGIDFSSPMLSIAKRKNKQFIKEGKVKIMQGNFDETSYKKNSFNKVCSVNTIYFWSKPEHTAKKVADLLEDGGMFIVAFEDKKQLETRNLDKNIFNLYSTDDVKNLLIKSGFSTDVSIKSRARGNSIYNCVVATK